MLLTIGMASYNNPEQVWWTVQCLRMYHDLTDCEIVVVDNAGNDALKNWCNSWGKGLRYYRYTEKRGTAPAKNRVFEIAKGDFVLCMDSHVMLTPNAVSDLKKFIQWVPGLPHLFHGPMYYDDIELMIDRMNGGWATHFFGKWGENLKEISSTPYEIPAHGMGLFGAFRQHWLKFNPEFIGFGGEEHYIHEKYRQAGHKILLLPFLRWLHRFHDQVSATTYPNVLEERLRNYEIGHDELGIDKTELLKHFGKMA